MKHFWLFNLFAAIVCFLATILMLHIGAWGVAALNLVFSMVNAACAVISYDNVGGL